MTTKYLRRLQNGVGSISSGSYMSLGDDEEKEIITNQSRSIALCAWLVFISLFCLSCDFTNYQKVKCVILAIVTHGNLFMRKERKQSPIIMQKKTTREAPGITR